MIERRSLGTFGFISPNIRSVNNHPLVPAFVLCVNASAKLKNKNRRFVTHSLFSVKNLSNF
jgi:hypothetical protein